uniref:NUMOD4 domain-containing protein n=1 Tax=uncultured Duncaniella sp. TaxID=2768039 RepID=UPI00349F20B6
MNIYDPLYKQIANLPNEVWKDIPEFEDAYEVSSAGRVRSKDRYIVAKDGSVRYVKPKIL